MRGWVRITKQKWEQSGYDQVTVYINKNTNDNHTVQVKTTFPFFNLLIVTKIHCVSSGVTLKFAFRDNWSMNLKSGTVTLKVSF
jgi:hypothetical protein